MIGGRAHAASHEASLAVIAGSALAIVAVFAVFAGVWWLNRRGAARLQEEFDLLDALMRE